MTAVATFSRNGFLQEPDRVCAELEQACAAYEQALKRLDEYKRTKSAKLTIGCSEEAKRTEADEFEELELIVSVEDAETKKVEAGFKLQFL